MTTTAMMCVALASLLANGPESWKRKGEEVVFWTAVQKGEQLSVRSERHAVSAEGTKGRRAARSLRETKGSAGVAPEERIPEVREGEGEEG